MVKQQGGQVGQAHGHQPHKQAHPQGLPHRVGHLCQVLRTHMVGHHRVDGHHHAHHADDEHVPDRHAQRYARQVLRRGVTRHGDFNHGHADIGQLTHQDRPGQVPETAQFGVKAAALRRVAYQLFKGAEQNGWGS